MEQTLLGKPARFPAGLQEIADGAFAWLQPNGEWGESNAGVVVGDDEALLVDTLWDLRLTQRMLDAVDGASPRADPDARQHALGRRPRVGQPARCPAPTSSRPAPPRT